MPEQEKKEQEKAKKGISRQIIEAITSGGFTVLKGKEEKESEKA